MEKLRRLIQFSLAVVVLAVGAGLMVGMIRTRAVPPRIEAEPRWPAVDVVAVKPVVEATPVVGYGTVRPARILPVVARTGGRLASVHEQLAPGKVIAEGEVLYAIDPAAHEATVRQVEAEIKALGAAQEIKEQETEGLAQRIERARELLRIDESDYQTARRLLDEEGVGNGRDVDLLKQKLLRQQGLLAELEDALRAQPVARRELDARLEASLARLEQARLELSATRATAPFAARVEQVSASRNQVVFPGQPIAVLSEVGIYEIAASVAASEIAWLHHEIEPKVLAEGVSNTAPVSRVTCSADGFREARPARVARLERIDELTRAARIVVEIEEPVDVEARDPSSGARSMSIVSGMYCRVEFPVEPRQEAIRVPRGAMVDERFVYVVELGESGDDRTARLAIREVSVLRSLGDSVLVDSGQGASGRSSELRFGELLVVSPPARPVPGMRVRPMRVDPPAVAEGR